MRSGIPQELNDCAPSDVRVSSDEWSHGALPNCTFPFEYAGVVYYECTKAGFNGQYWCANDCAFNTELQYRMRGVCVLPDAPSGVLGLGVNLSIMNVFISLLLIAGFSLVFVVCVSEVRSRRAFARVGVEETSFQLPGFEPQRSGGAQRFVLLAPRVGEPEN